MVIRSAHPDWFTPSEAAAFIPGASPISVRRWCNDGLFPGAIQLPSGRWQIPWHGIVSILGFDSKLGEFPDSHVIHRDRK